MSTAFRTPILDTLRNIIQSFSKNGGDEGLFSLRLHRSCIRALYRLYTKNDLAQLGGVLDPKILGRGLWFRFWSRRVRSRCLSLSTISSTFVNPLELIFGNPHKQALAESTANLARTMGGIFLLFPKVYLTPLEARGLEFQKRRLECHYPWNWGQYEIRCDGNGKEFANYITDPKIRDRILRAYYKTFTNEFHLAILKVLQDRQNFAKSLKFDSWTEMQYAMNGIADLHIIEKMFLSGGQKLLKNAYRQYPKIATTDEGHVRNKLYPELPPSSGGEYRQVLSEIVKKLTEFFQTDIIPVPHDSSKQGWHPDVLCFRVVGHGFIYLDLFRRPFSALAGSPPHCSVLSEGHVRIHMGLIPPHRSEITFKKERNLTTEEITALWHEFGHAMHVLLRPRGAPIAQLPMDMREAPSILCEMFALGKTRNVFFYTDIIRNIAVFDFLHSKNFDPFTANIDELIFEARRVYAQFSSPVELTDYFNPLAGELGNYLIDGESRTGYILAYMQTAQSLQNGEQNFSQIFQQFKNNFIQNDSFNNSFVSNALNHVTPNVHPYPPTTDSTALWKTVKHFQPSKRAHK